MKIRDRIKELRRVPASELQPHPRNWRTHPTKQRDALRGVLAEIGYADALLVRPLPGGALQLIDGHLRAEISPDALVPVLVLDLDDDEALKLLATFDPLASMAEVDAEALSALVADVHTDNAAVSALLDELLAGHPAIEPAQSAEPGDAVLPTLFQVVVECQDEHQQRSVFDRLTAEGFKCRVMVL